jgi:putative SOS response-associated peptidase YedK
MGQLHRTKFRVFTGKAQAQPTETIEQRFNAYPNHDKYKLPVITEEEADKILMFYWGLLPVWWKRDERGLINVKYETLRDKKTFHKDLAERRCLGPTGGNVRRTAIRAWRFPFDHSALALSCLFARFRGLTAPNEGKKSRFRVKWEKRAMFYTYT